MRFRALSRRQSTGIHIAVITPDDVDYMILTDRFADGDPANNDDIDKRMALGGGHMIRAEPAL